MAGLAVSRLTGRTKGQVINIFPSFLPPPRSPRLRVSSFQSLIGLPSKGSSLRLLTSSPTTRTMRTAVLPWTGLANGAETSRLSATVARMTDQPQSSEASQPTRRQFLRGGAQGVCLFGLGSLGGLLAGRGASVPVAPPASGPHPGPLGKVVSYDLGALRRTDPQ